jgi:hypothetical protein
MSLTQALFYHIVVLRKNGNNILFFMFIFRDHTRHMACWEVYLFRVYNSVLVNLASLFFSDPILISLNFNVIL